ncbi:Bro-N domain-containing protein, partial [Heliobacterium chlorum]|nr:Bro-N domain-containing protein [Heliobacterium chlorum]
MNQLQRVFNYQGNQVRTVIIDNEPWFIAKDVCDVLEHSNSRKALERLDADEKGVTKLYTPGGLQELSIISESGLTELIWTSRLPEAKDFKRWVKKEVLPSIRKTGKYEIESSTTPKPTPAEFLLLMAEQLVAMEKQIQ